MSVLVSVLVSVSVPGIATVTALESELMWAQSTGRVAALASACGSGFVMALAVASVLGVVSAPTTDLALARATELA